MTISQRIDAARRDLLDLSLRNQLLNHRPSKTRGVTVSDELPAQTYRLLWDDERTSTFVPAKVEPAAGADRGETAEPPAAGHEPEERHRDTRLQTTHLAERLQARLIATARDARFVEEEQGVNVLFLALGFLRWREPDVAADAPWRFAPLCLMPVRLARTRADAQFTVAAADAEPLGNLTLAVKLKADTGIILPELPAADGLDLEAWFGEVADAISGRADWRVERRVALDLFAFGRHLMWRDLDPAAWPAGDGPAERPLVARLFGGGFAPLPPPPTSLDDVRPPEQAGEVVESDGSQAEALAAVAAGADLVIQGPPGTGKSQTICNLIAEAVAGGKSVLFVAEKMAALGVVQRRLESIGLGALCLELHSDKAAKRAVLGEIGRTLKADAPPPAPGTELNRGYATVRSELSAFAAAMARPIGHSGCSPGDALDALAATGIRERVLPAEVFADQDASTIAAQEAALHEVEAALMRSGPLTRHPWGAARLTTVLPAVEQSLGQLVAACLATLPAARDAATALAGVLGADPPAGPAASARVLTAARHAAARPPGIADPDSPAWTVHPGELDRLCSDGQAYADMRRQHDDMLIPEAWDQDLVQVRSDLAAYGEGTFRWISGAWRAANARIKGLCRGAPPRDHASQLALVDAVLAARRLAQAVRSREDLGAALFGPLWRAADSDWSALTAARAWARAWNEGRRSAGWPACRAIEASAAAAAIATLAPALEAWSVADERLRSALAATNDHPSWTAVAQRLAAQAPGTSSLHDVCAVNRAAEPLAGLPAVAALARAWERPEPLAAHVRAARLGALLDRALAASPELARFDAATHDRSRARFGELDIAVLAANRLRLVHAHRARLPGASEGGAAALLRRESEKKMRHLPIRTLLREAGSAVQRVKPVFLMSPLSVAAYLEPGGLRFDLVVFDEASQVRPVDAVGALARGRQLVVVGDSRQMPPTSFFDRMLGGDAEDGEEAGWASDLESVLGLCLGSGCPSAMLRWHYRSRHPSLIATSNRCFYENRLRTFPSPAGAPRADGDGLTLTRLPDAVYDRARSRTNPGEAAAVAEAVIAHARATPQLSLGVAAFSQAQMLAISGEVERRRRLDGSTEAFFAAHANEPFFVKNLENVQGDERDVILISVCYGRDADGTVAMNFGPLNADGGERRLNVLITRARRRMRVFTNLMPEDIDERRTQAKGVLALKTFLAYARDGREPGATTVPLTGTAAALAPPGAEPVGAGGVAWRQGDVAVRLDDAAWSAAATCRDRERLADQVLAGLGWRVHHAWRLGWWRRPDEEHRRLAAATAKP